MLLADHRIRSLNLHSTNATLLGRVRDGREVRGFLLSVVRRAHAQRR